MRSLDPSLIAAESKAGTEIIAPLPSLRLSPPPARFPTARKRRGGLDHRSDSHVQLTRGPRPASSITTKGAQWIHSDYGARALSSAIPKEFPRCARSRTSTLRLCAELPYTMTPRKPLTRQGVSSQSSDSVSLRQV